MSLTHRLREEAEAFDESLRKEIAEATIEKQFVERSTNKTRLAFLEKEINLATAARKRVAFYHPEKQKEHHECPYCWLLEGKRIVLGRVPGRPNTTIGCWNCAGEYKLDE